jgi:hypothetical protein
MVCDLDESHPEHRLIPPTDDMKSGFSYTALTPECRSLALIQPTTRSNSPLIAWNTAKIDDIKPDQQNPAIVYLNSKAVAERKVWEMAENYPNLDFTTSMSLHKVDITF